VQRHAEHQVRVRQAGKRRRARIALHEAGTLVGELRASAHHVDAGADLAIGCGFHAVALQTSSIKCSRSHELMTRL
jgi:hypothetical protein